MRKSDNEYVMRYADDTTLLAGTNDELTECWNN